MEDILYQPKNYLIEDKNFHFVLLHLNINKDLIEFEDWDESMHN